MSDSFLNDKLFRTNYPQFACVHIVHNLCEFAQFAKCAVHLAARVKITVSLRLTFAQVRVRVRFRVRDGVETIGSCCSLLSRYVGHTAYI